jgi:glutamyl-tRNA synthetase
VYAHVPLMLGPDGARLAKRHGAVTLADRAELGQAASDVRRELLTPFGLGECETMEELVEHFDPRVVR